MRYSNAFSKYNYKKYFCTLFSKAFVFLGNALCEKIFLLLFPVCLMCILKLVHLHTLQLDTFCTHFFCQKPPN